MNKPNIEIELIALRCSGNDPFIEYQEGRLSKRKLIEVIADALSHRIYRGWSLGK